MGIEGVEVRITGDATGAEAASKASASAVANASNLMRTKLAEIQESARLAFGGMGEAAEVGALKVSEASKMVEMAGERMAVGASTARTAWAMVGQSFSKLNGIMLAITAALAGGALFKDAIEATNKLTAENLRLSRALGVTLEKASGVHAAMTKLGIETDTVTNASQKMVRQLRSHEDAFNKFGIVTRDANGHFRTTLDILTDGLGRLGEYKAGVDRTAISQMMFGRGAGDLTTLMRLNNKEIEEGTRVAKELGLVTTTEGVTAMHAYKDSVHEVSEIMEAFKVALGQAMLPVLTELSNWFRTRGPAAVRTFSGVMLDLIDTFKSAGLTIRWMMDQINHLGASISAFVENASSRIEQLKVEFETIGKVIRDALTLNWGSIEADWNAGMAKIDAIATNHARHIAEEMGKAKAAIDATEYAMSHIGVDRMLDGVGGDPRSLNPSWLHLADAEPGGLRADDIKGGKPKKEKKPKKGPAGPSLLEEWNAELDKALAAEKNWGVDELAFTLKFWEEKLALHKTKSKEQLELENKINKLKLQAHKEVLQEELKDDRQHAALAADQAQTEIALQREILQAKLDLLNRQERAGQISATKAARQRADLNREIYQLDLDLEQKLYEIKLNELKSERSIYREETKEYKDYTRQIELIEQQHLNRMALLNQQNARKIAADQAAAAATSAQRWQQLANSFASALSRMATLQAGFMTTLKSLWGSLVGFVAQILEQIIAKFIMAQLVKLGLVKAEAAATIPAEAAKAGAGGTASMAAAPWPLNMTAPAFGASMAAIAMSFAPAASAMGGWDVPGGAGAGVDGRGGRSAIIHPREMVLPADLADQVRGGGGGGNHLHLHGAIIHNPSQLKRWFEANSHAVGAGVRQFVRKGGNTSPNR